MPVDGSPYPTGDGLPNPNLEVNNVPKHRAGPLGKADFQKSVTDARAAIAATLEQPGTDPKMKDWLGRLLGLDESKSAKKPRRRKQK